jgi:16S rRNA (uracil1498-N3)-methyltransferase
MRANYKLQRLFVRGDLLEGIAVPLDETQAHYLLTVLRKEDGAEVLAFNGNDGEWICTVKRDGKRQAFLTPQSQSRPQPAPSALRFLFAPLKVGRLDFLVEKATEMGAGTIEPVVTEFTQNRHVSVEKLQRWVLEAAEQCGVLAVPEIAHPKTLEAALEGWDAKVPLIFCDEDSPFDNPLTALVNLKRGPLALLVGPEGGFSDVERKILRQLPFVTAIPLGPRILRADTAAIAALAVVQATIGDW